MFEKSFFRRLSKCSQRKFLGLQRNTSGLIGRKNVLLWPLKWRCYLSVWYVLSISSTSLHIRFTECFISVQILTWVVSIVFGFVFRCEIIRVSKKPSGLFVVFGCFKPWPNEKTPSKHYCKTFEIGLPYQGFLPK